MKAYDSYRVSNGEQPLTAEKKLRQLSAVEQLMDILIDFGKSVDPEGYDDGDYDTAMSRLLEMLRKQEPNHD